MDLVNNIQLIVVLPKKCSTTIVLNKSASTSLKLYTKCLVDINIIKEINIEVHM